LLPHREGIAVVVKSDLRKECISCTVGLNQRGVTPDPIGGGKRPVVIGGQGITAQIGDRGAECDGIGSERCKGGTRGKASYIACAIEADAARELLAPDSANVKLVASTVTANMFSSKVAVRLLLRATAMAEFAGDVVLAVGAVVSLFEPPPPPQADKKKRNIKGRYMLGRVEVALLFIIFSFVVFMRYKSMMSLSCKTRASFFPNQSR